MMSLFLHPLGWTSERVRVLCGPDVEPFYVGDCSMGKKDFFDGLKVMN